MNTIENTINPFELDQSEMVHITSGIIANDKVKNDLQNVKAIGEERLSAFVQTKLLDILQQSKKQNCIHFHH